MTERCAEACCPDCYFNDCQIYRASLLNEIPADYRDDGTVPPTTTEKEQQVSRSGRRRCETFLVDRQPVRVQTSGAGLTEADREAFAEVVRAARRKYDAEHPAPTTEKEQP